MKSLFSGLGTYLVIYGVLMLLLALTVITARFDLGAGSVIVALAIAGAKSFLILVYFMHVKESPWIRPVLFGLFVFLSVIAALTASDYFTRQGVS